jgi:diguanylate cyclase (GGDEF)-like protein/PAS domain S-box-containing protein
MQGRKVSITMLRVTHLKKELVDRLLAIKPLHLLWLSVACSILFTQFIVFPMSLYFHGTITHDLLVTGIVCAFFVSLVICYLLVTLIDQVRESETRFRSLFETMTEAVALHDIIFNEHGVATDYRIVAVNPAFETHTGLSANKAVGSLASALYGAAPPYLEEYVTVASTGLPRCFETYYAPFGKHFRIEVFSPAKDKFITVFEDITERKKAAEDLKLLNEILKGQATTDLLTGISNRAKISELLEIEISRSKRFALPLSIIMFDVDHFKNINDTYGHNAGDNVLREVSKKISKFIRKNDHFARWGGEEFVIMVTNTKKNNASIFAEKLRCAVEQFDVAQIGRITCSFGVADLDKTDNMESLIHKADTAMYAAKSAGRNLVKLSS